MQEKVEELKSGEKVDHGGVRQLPTAPIVHRDATSFDERLPSSLLLAVWKVEATRLSKKLQIWRSDRRDLH